MLAQFAFLVAIIAAGLSLRLNPFLFAALALLPFLLGNVQDAFKYNKARKQAIIGGMVILVAITLISCVSSFQVYKLGFVDLPHPFPAILSLVAVIVVEGGFVWLVFGFTRAFSSFMERCIALCGMCFLVAVMCINIVTHFMMVKGFTLSPFQHAWLGWGAVTVFIGVLLCVLFITLADPVIRLIRLELKYTGRQQEIILDAKTEGLESDRIQTAMASRADWEAQELADRIMNGGRSRGATAQGESRAGFTSRTRTSNYTSSNFADYDPKDQSH